MISSEDTKYKDLMMLGANNDNFEDEILFQRSNAKPVQEKLS